MPIEDVSTEVLQGRLLQARYHKNVLLKDLEEVDKIIQGVRREIYRRKQKGEL
jgi:hypothetical protein